MRERKPAREKGAFAGWGPVFAMDPVVMGVEGGALSVISLRSARA